MQKFFLLFSFLIYTSLSFGQHGTKVKQTAQAMLQAKERKDYDAYVNYFYPAELKSRGGKAKWVQAMKNNDPYSNAISIKSGKQSLGKVSKIYKAGKELHCLIDWNVPMGKIINRWHFLAISGDQGKTWKFIMTPGKTPSEVWGMVPKFNEDLTWVDYSE